MNKLEKILEYFISHEKSNRLNNIKISGKNYINIKREDISNVNYLSVSLLAKKVELIKNIVGKMQFENSDSLTPINNKLEEILKEKLDLISNFEISSLLNEEDYKFPDNYKNDLSQITNIINDSQITILYPVLYYEKKKFPLIWSL